jgi:hypothetical protein
MVAFMEKEMNLPPGMTGAAHAVYGSYDVNTQFLRYDRGRFELTFNLEANDMRGSVMHCVVHKYLRVVVVQKTFSSDFRIFPLDVPSTLYIPNVPFLKKNENYKMELWDAFNDQAKFLIQNVDLRTILQKDKRLWKSSEKELAERFASQADDLRKAYQKYIFEEYRDVCILSGESPSAREARLDKDISTIGQLTKAMEKAQKARQTQSKSSQSSTNNYNSVRTTRNRTNKIW